MYVFEIFKFISSFLFLFVYSFWGLFSFIHGKEKERSVIINHVFIHIFLMLYILLVDSLVIEKILT